LDYSNYDSFVRSFYNKSIDQITNSFTHSIFSLQQITLTPVPNTIRNLFLSERERLDVTPEICYHGSDPIPHPIRSSQSSESLTTTSFYTTVPSKPIITRHQNGLWYNLDNNDNSRGNGNSGFKCFTSLSSVFPYTARRDRVDVCAYLPRRQARPNVLTKGEGDSIMIHSYSHILPLFTLHIRPLQLENNDSLSPISKVKLNHITKAAKNFLRKKKHRLQAILASKMPYSVRTSVSRFFHIASTE